MEMRTTDKPFNITKRQVYEAYKAVKSNGGGAGVDKQTIEEFETDLKGNLYKLWNRMSSGSYFPPPVRAVPIPKKSGGQRILGVPTVADRVAQMVVKQLIEPDLEPVFLADSYGYRPGKSALDAVGVTRERCWRYDWVLEFDIKGLFDNIDHALLLRAVRKHVTCKWALLYIERWLTAPMEQNDGTVVERKRGTPQGDVVNPPSAGGSPQKQAPSALRLATGIKCLAERWLRICPASCMSARPGDACPGRRCGTGQMVKSAGRRSRPAYARNSGIPIKVRVRLSLF
jgi:retron-type reverse transcriptase